MLITTFFLSVLFILRGNNVTFVQKICYFVEKSGLRKIQIKYIKNIYYKHGDWVRNFMSGLVEFRQTIARSIVSTRCVSFSTQARNDIYKIIPKYSFWYFLDNYPYTTNNSIEDFVQIKRTNKADFKLDKKIFSIYVPNRKKLNKFNRDNFYFLNSPFYSNSQSSMFDAFCQLKKYNLLHIIALFVSENVNGNYISSLGLIEGVYQSFFLAGEAFLNITFAMVRMFKKKNFSFRFFYRIFQSFFFFYSTLFCRRH